MAEPYTLNPPNGGTDDYRCFLIDPKLASKVFLTGAQFQPQNLDLVHHAIFFRIDPEHAAKAREIDQRTPGQGWTCPTTTSTTSRCGSCPSLSRSARATSYG
ncbi:hypothetical protein AB0K16_47160 [Nonomuraea jabiensis]|uniref:hypothetical protein n=1 Tax=Nonomuraea jabiensis TaxID=882448 RepID=UPI00342EDA2B